MNNYYDDSDVTARYGYKVAEDPTAVSYTHLDVYKRQVSNISPLN